MTFRQKFAKKKRLPWIAALGFLASAISNKALMAKKKADGKPVAAHLYSETANYVHNWVKLPEIIGKDLNGDDLVQKPEPGVMDILVFVASWCVPCQQIIPRMQKLEKRFNKINIRFTYIFSHDLLADVKGFAAEYKIEKAIIASHTILKSYHNPDLPGIYIGDRNGWLLSRSLKVQADDFKSLEEKLELLAAF